MPDRKSNDALVIDVQCRGDRPRSPVNISDVGHIDVTLDYWIRRRVGVATPYEISPGVFL